MCAMFGGEQEIGIFVAPTKGIVLPTGPKQIGKEAGHLGNPMSTDKELKKDIT